MNKKGNFIFLFEFNPDTKVVTFKHEAAGNLSDLRIVYSELLIKADQVVDKFLKQTTHE